MILFNQETVGVSVIVFVSALLAFVLFRDVRTIGGAFSAFLYSYLVAPAAFLLGLKLGSARPFLRYGLLVAWLAGLSGLAWFGSAHVSIAAASLATFCVVVVSWEWSVNESYREALIVGNEKGHEYWLPQRYGKDGWTPADLKDIDSLPDLWDEALFSAILLFPLLAYLGLIVAANGGEPDLAQFPTWLAHVFDRLVQSLPIDIMGFFNADGFGGALEPRPKNSVNATSLFDVIVSLSVAFAIVTGIARMIQRERLAAIAASVFARDPRMAARMGLRALRLMETQRPPNHAGEREAFSKKFIAKLYLHANDESDEAKCVASIQALSVLEEPGILPIAAEKLRRSTSDAVQTAAAAAMTRLASRPDERRKIKTEDVGKALLTLIERPSGPARREAVRAITALKDINLATQLAHQLSRVKDESVCIAIMRALGELRSGHLVRHVLEFAEQTNSESVKLAALDTLKELNIGAKKYKDVVVFCTACLAPSMSTEARIAAVSTIHALLSEDAFEPAHFRPAIPLLEKTLSEALARNDSQSAAKVRHLIKELARDTNP